MEQPKYIVLSIQDPLFPFPCYFGDDADEERAYTFSIEEARSTVDECQGPDYAIIVDIANRKVID